jgi:flagellin-specific chaperone FliS
MSYELFEKAAAANGEFEVIPSKINLLAEGIVIDNKGHIKYKEQTYVTNIIKLADLPTKLQKLFIEKKSQVQKGEQEVIEVKEKKNDKFEQLNNILFEQLQNIVDPDEGTDISQELKKANAICNVADKIISIADLSLKAEIFHHKKRFPAGKSLYQD